MISADIQTDAKWQEIKEVVVISYNFSQKCHKTSNAMQA